MNILSKFIDFLKYGKIVHVCANSGNVIRRKWNNSIFSNKGINSVKTVLDKNGTVVKQMIREKLPQQYTDQTYHAKFEIWEPEKGWMIKDRKLLLYSDRIFDIKRDGKRNTDLTYGYR